MKVAKADPEEFERVMRFVSLMESFFEGRSFFSSEEDWRDWPNDDEDKKRLLEIEKDLVDAGEATWDGHPDNRLILFEFIKEKWKYANWSGSFGRIVIDAEVLIENACDPELDYLEWKPELKAFIEKLEEEKKEKWAGELFPPEENCAENK